MKAQPNEHVQGKARVIRELPPISELEILVPTTHLMLFMESLQV